MKWVKNWELFRESKEWNNKNLITEICVSMSLINPEFLSNLLDKGLKARYSSNSNIFLTDLKNLVLAKNRLVLGKWIDDKCVEDVESAKINGAFESIQFDIEKDWNLLINSRLIARSIVDKLIPDEKLSEERIRKVFWIGPNKSKEFSEDIVIELTDGKQYPLYLGKSLSLQKTSSFSTFADDLIKNDIEKLYTGDNIRKWNKLTSEWIRIIYESAHKNIQAHIEKFIDVSRIETIDYFNYFSIKHRDPRFKTLGEFIKELDKNILYLSDLMNLIWKNKEETLMDSERAEKEWKEVKTVVLNSRIIEHLLTTSLKTNNPDDIIKLESGFKKASGTVKMKLIKTVVNKLGCEERDLFFVSKNGAEFWKLPSRDFFRKKYEDIDVLFDYHVKFDLKEGETNDVFTFKIILESDEKEILSMDILVDFVGGAFGEKLNSKFKFNLPSNFNYLTNQLEQI